MSQCALCQGAPPERVLPQYVQSDPTKGPVPTTPEDPLFLYEEEAEAAASKQPWPGLLRPLFRALGLIKEPPPVTPEQPALAEPRSKKIARSKKTGGLFER